MYRYEKARKVLLHFSLRNKIFKLLGEGPQMLWPHRAAKEKQVINHPQFRPLFSYFLGKDRFMKTAYSWDQTWLRQKLDLGNQEDPSPNHQASNTKLCPLPQENQTHRASDYLRGKRVQGGLNLRINQEHWGKASSKPDSILSTNSWEIWSQRCTERWAYQEENPNLAHLLI